MPAVPLLPEVILRRVEKLGYHLLVGTAAIQHRGEEIPSAGVGVAVQEVLVVAEDQTVLELGAGAFPREVDELKVALVTLENDGRHLRVRQSILIVDEKRLGGGVDVAVQTVLVHDVEERVEVIAGARREIFGRADENVLELFDGRAVYQ